MIVPLQREGVWQMSKAFRVALVVLGLLSAVSVPASAGGGDNRCTGNNCNRP